MAYFSAVLRLITRFGGICSDFPKNQIKSAIVFGQLAHRWLYRDFLCKKLAASISGGGGGPDFWLESTYIRDIIGIECRNRIGKSLACLHIPFVVAPRCLFTESISLFALIEQFPRLFHSSFHFINSPLLFVLHFRSSFLESWKQHTYV